MSFNEARKAALPDIARTLGFKLSGRAGGKFVSKACPACGSGSGSKDHVSYYTNDAGWRWKCFRCGAGGSPIDFVAAAMSLRDREAVDWIMSGQHAASLVATKQFELSNTEEERAAAIAQVIDRLIPKAYTLSETCFTYLRTRGIEPQVTMEASRRGLIRFLPPVPEVARTFLVSTVGEDLLRRAEILRSSMPAIAYRPIIFPFPGGGAAAFRLARQPRNEKDVKEIRYGHAKWPWYWKPEGETKRIYIVEGMIDMLSMVQMGKARNNTAIMAIPGVSAWKPDWMFFAHRVNPKAEFVISLDADGAGQTAAVAMQSFLRENRIPCAIESPAAGKDWNETLLAKAA